VNSIEDILRESFEARVEHQPALREPAERAINGARTVRRRRAVFVACAAIVAVVLAGLSALPRATAPPGPIGPATIAPSVPTTPTPVTMRIAGILRLPNGNALLLPDGTQVNLSQVEVSKVYRTADGWVGIGFIEQLDQGSLWLVSPDHKLHILVPASQGPVVLSADGRQFAWMAGNQLKTGHLSGTTLKVDRTTAAPARGRVLAIVGSVVALGATQTGGGIDSFDVWPSERGPYAPAWDQNPVVAIYGPAPDGHSFLGLTPPGPGRKDACLALLEAAENLRATRTTCIPDLPLTPEVQMSPDGHWLAMSTRENNPGSGHVDLIDLMTVFDHPVMTTPWAAADSPLGWVDGNTLIAIRNNRLVRCLVGQPETAPVVVPGIPAGTTFEPIPVKSG
jgi:hypothetical protein